MPRETMSTSAGVDSLLRENAELQSRVYLIEKEIRGQRDYSRNSNAQLKIDLDELKDQMNALQQIIREIGQVPPRPPEGFKAGVSDTSGVDAAPAGVRTREVPGTGTGETPEAGGMKTGEAGDTLSEAAAGADTSVSRVVESVPPPEEIYRQAYLDFSRGAYGLVLEESELFLKEYPDHSLGEEVRFIRGESFMEQEKYFDALKEFSLLLQDYPNGRRVPATLFRMTVSYDSIGERDIAAGVVRRLLREYPYSEEAVAAEERFGDLLRD